MAQDKNFVTKEGLEKLKEEYNYLVHVENPKVIQELAEARAQGDLSENADYDAARDNQARVHARINELEAMIKNAVIIGEDRSDAGKVVGLGSRVTILDLTDNYEETLTIVGSVEANPFEGQLSNMTPLAVALMNGKVGDVVTVTGVEVPYDVKIVALEKSEA